MYQLGLRPAIPGGIGIPAYAMPVRHTAKVTPARAYKPMRVVDPGMEGIGQMTTTQAAEGAGIATAAAIGQALIPIPGAGAAIGAVGALIASLFQPNLQKIAASNDANEIELILQNNLANWLSLAPSQKTTSVQAAALAVFDKGWLQYESAVQPLLSKAPNSISDRASGSCAYHTAQCAGWTQGGVYIPNGPNQATGCCWNWEIGYRRPIADDPEVGPDPTGSVGGSSIGGVSSSFLLYAAIAAIAAAVIL